MSYQIDLNKYPHVHSLDEMLDHKGEMVIYHRPKDYIFNLNYEQRDKTYNEYLDLTFINYVSDKLIVYTMLSSDCEYSRRTAYTNQSIFYKHDKQDTEWIKYLGMEDIIRAFIPNFAQDKMVCDEFKFSYADFAPKLIDTSDGTVEIYSNDYVFTETVVEEDNFKWYRLHLNGSSLNERALRIRDAENDENFYIKYQVNDNGYRAKIKNFFFIRNERTKVWRLQDSRKLKQTKASREWFEGFKILNMLSD